MSCATSKPMRFKARMVGIMSPVLSSVFHSLAEDSKNHAYIETLVTYVSGSPLALDSKNTKCFTIWPTIKFVFNAWFDISRTLISTCGLRYHRFWSLTFVAE